LLPPDPAPPSPGSDSAAPLAIRPAAARITTRVDTINAGSRPSNAATRAPSSDNERARARARARAHKDVPAPSAAVSCSLSSASSCSLLCRLLFACHTSARTPA
jgi:hypothetical protein